MTTKQDTPFSYYRPDVDGLRALAVIAVVLFHAHIPGFAGGYVGVDIFFVISGFLITSILIREMRQGTFSFLNFFERRVRRIIPALFVMVFTLLLVGYFVLLFPVDYRELGQSAFAQSIFLANFFFVREGGYFSPLAEHSPLLHTWTLAVEEQFYLVFPVFLFVVWRFFYKYLLSTLLVVGVISFALCVYLLTVSPQESFSLPFFPDIWGNATNAKVAFYLLPSRAWEFVVGGLIAVTGVALRRKYQATILSTLGLGAILYAIVFYDTATLFPGTAALLPVLGSAALIVAGVEQKTFVGRLLSFPLFIGVGLISYSLYLWHWPILVLAKEYVYTEFSQQYTALLIVISFFVAYLSYRFIETPFRTKQVCKSKMSMLTIGLGAMGLLTLLSIVLVKNDGFANRAPVEARQVAAAAVDFGPRRNECFVNSFSVSDEPCLLGAGDQEKIDFVLWGDSHAGGLFPLVDAMAGEYGYTGASFISPGCQPTLHVQESVEKNACDKVNALAAAYIETRGIKNILVTAHWVGNEENLLNIVTAFRLQSIHVTVVHEPPLQEGFDIRQLFYKITQGESVADAGIPLQEYQRNQSLAIAMVDQLYQFPTVSIIDPSDLLCEEGACRLTVDGLFVYYDNRHLNVTGVMTLRPLFENFFARLDDKG